MSKQVSAIMDIVFSNSYTLRRKAQIAWAEADRINDKAVEQHEMGLISEQEYYLMVAESQAMQDYAEQVEEARAIVWEYEQMEKAKLMEGAN